VAAALAAVPAAAPAAGAAEPARLVAPPAALSGGSPLTTCARTDRAVQRGAEVEPHLAADPAGSGRLVATWQQDRRTTGAAVGVAVAASADGGRTWTRRRLPGGAPCGAGGFTGASDPWAAIGPDGIAYLATLPVVAPPGRPVRSTDIAVHRSSDLGLTWEPPAALTRDAAFDDKETVTADPRRAGVAHAVWKRGDDAEAFIATTTDGGRTWGAPVRVPPADRMVGHVVHVLPDGALLMTATTLSPTPAYVALRSDDGGATWAAPAVVGGAVGGRARDAERGRFIRAGGFPGVAVLPDGRVVAVWERSGVRRSQLLQSTSVDGGRSWSPQRRILLRRGQAFTPALAAAPDGSLGLSWYETGRDRPGDAALTTDVAFAHSRDGGRTWTARRLLGPFDLRRAPRARGALFLGDYTGIAPVPGGFGVLSAVASPLARRGASDVVFARVRLPAR
jgi:Neuraminidase (sialidase)